MATAPEPVKKHPLMAKGPLYAFALPLELLEVIALRTAHDGRHRAVTSAEVDGDGSDGTEAASDDLQSSATTTALGCNQCQVKTFETLTEQRSHFASDWHRYNVKRKLANKPAVNAKSFEQLVDDLTDSLSDTASSQASDESASGDDSRVLRLMAKQDLNGGDHDDQPLQPDSISPRSPVVWFEAKGVISETQFGIYRTVFPSAVKKNMDLGWTDELKRLQVTPDNSSLGKRDRSVLTGRVLASTSSRTWTLLAIGGGHFAGIIISLTPKLVNHNGRIDQEVVVLQSKTFHRYTTRRKQGGAQSANDNAKGKAKSAGAQIRRYNEAMLRDEIRQLLTSWKDQIDASELVFVRAGKSSHRIFYDYEDAALQRRDPRIRTFPFPTRRPTQAELVRCFAELTRVKMSHLSQEQLDALDEAYIASISIKPKSQPAPPKVDTKPAAPQLSAEEIAERDRWERAISMVQKGRLEALKAFIAKQPSFSEDGNSYCGLLPAFSPHARQHLSLLHLAAASDQPEVVRWLLLECRADPTLTSSAADDTIEGAPSSRRTPYEASASRTVRNVFRRCYADHPEWWDWKGKARVPSPLTEEAETAQNAQAADRQNLFQEKLREKAAAREAEAAAEATKEKERADAEARRQAEIRRTIPNTKPQKLGGGSAPQKVLDGAQIAGMSAEARARLERERRARAAEARLQGRS